MTKIQISKPKAIICGEYNNLSTDGYVRLAGECPRWSEMIVTIFWWGNNIGNSALNP